MPTSLILTATLRDKTKSAFRALGRSLGRTERDAEGLGDKLRGLNRIRFGGLLSGLRKLKGPILAAGAAIAGLGAGIIALGVKFANEERVIARYQTMLGLTADQVEAVFNSAKKAGQDGEDVFDGLIASQEKARLAVLQGEEAVADFAAEYGFAVTELVQANGEVLAAETGLNNLSAALLRNKNVNERTVVATALGGDAFAYTLKTILELGDGGVDALVEAARANGELTSPEARRSITEFTQAWDDFNTKLQPLLRDLFSALAPVFQAAIEWIDETGIPWLRDAVERFRDELFGTDETFRVMPEVEVAPGDWVFRLGDYLEVETEADPDIVEKVETWWDNNVTGPLDRLMGNPVGTVLRGWWIMVGVAWDGLVLAAQAAWSAIKSINWSEVWNLIESGASLAWSEIAAAAGRYWDLIKRTIESIDWTGVWNLIKAGALRMWERIESAGILSWDNIRLAILNADWTGAWNLIKAGAELAFGRIKFAAETAWSGIKIAAGIAWTAINTHLNETFLPAWRTTWRLLKETPERIFDGLKTSANLAWSGIKIAARLLWNGTGGLVSVFKTAANSVITIMEIMVNRVIGGINSIIRTWNSLEFSAPLGLGTVGTPDIGTIGTVSIPRLAKGGIVKSPTLAMIGEAGPEAVIPLDRRRPPPITINLRVDGSVYPSDLEREVEHAVRRGIEAYA